MPAPVCPFIRQLPASPKNIGERGGTKIDMLILHVTQGSMAGAAARFRTPPARPRDAVSAHLGVTRKGEFYQFVPLDRMAFHCGNIAYNRRSIGIEMEGRVEDPGLVTVPLLLGVETLVNWLCALHDIPMDRQHIIGHAEVPDPNDPKKLGGASHHTDPGPNWPWSTLMQELTKSNVA